MDGDDAVELLIDYNGDGDFEGPQDFVLGWYGAHGDCGTSEICFDSHSDSIYLPSGSYTFQYRQQEVAGSQSYKLRWEQSLNSTIENLRVRVRVADDNMPEANCRRYPDGNYKPVGILQRHGESNSMYFGLLTGSYTNNTSGGILRSPMRSFREEVDSDNGTFTALKGIVHTIDHFRIAEFDYGDYSYLPNWPDAWVTTRAMRPGEFPDWGNPVAEMMYETMRYFSGASGPTSAYYDISMPLDEDLDLPVIGSWTDPYNDPVNNFPYCAKPFMLVLSDIYPTYDSDELPGSPFGSMAPAAVGQGGALNVSTRADTIFATEMASGDRFIGDNGSLDDGACTAKTVNGFGNIRGLCPEEPTKQGSYYSAAVSYYGHGEDISSAQGDQNMRTYAVGLASPLPKIEIPIQGKTIRLVPFAKSVGGCLGLDPAQGLFQPTNTIVDFFVEEISPHHGRFRINFEDVEQAADHDMDAIIVYEYQLVDSAGNAVTEATIGQAAAVNITLRSEYASGCIIQHAGYIISGSAADGTYLEVRDLDTDTDVDYFLDTADPAYAAAHTGLPLEHTRTFSVDSAGGSSAAALLPNPLWYAAKWGAFEDHNGNDLPDLQEEWDKDLDGVPDTYYYVVNPLKLEQQLNRSFADILAKTSSGTAAAVVANNSEGQGTMIQAFFKPQFFAPDKDEPLSFLGYLKSLWVDQFGHLREDSDHNFKYNYDTDKIIEYGTDDSGNVFVRRYTQHYHYEGNNQFDGQCVIANCATSFETIGIEDIETLFAAGEMLHRTSAGDRKIFTFLDGDGNDNDGDGQWDQSGEIEGAKIVGQVSAPFSDAADDANGEVVEFKSDTTGKRIKPFLGLKSDDQFSYLETGGPDHDTRVENLINYIRGLDSADLTGTPNTRDRTFDGDVWKLGDIVRSTPVSISGAVENYAVIYSDETYLAYSRKYADRETVVYAGANDGMLHAFTHGRYVFDENANVYGYEPVDGTPIGSELWAYIPQTLLPHLKWLADPDYGHTFYVDLKPKIFDARVFPDDNDHPDGWGTILLVGLGAGGKHILAEGDFDYSNVTGDVIRDFLPTYVCMDITNPRKPRLLWERAYENLGMSTNFPTVVQVGAEYSMGTHQWSGGKWFLVFGSGPNDPIAKTDYSGYSQLEGHIFVVDVLTGELERRLDTGGVNTIMASPAALDKAADDGSGVVQGLTYNVDAIYMGSASYDGSDWFGRMFKINTRYPDSVPSADPDDWQLSVLFNSERPITAAPALSMDLLDNVWVLFGTGRFQEMADRETTEQNYIIGLKDPYFNAHYNPTDDQGYPNPQYNGIGDFYHNNGQERHLSQSDLFYSNPYAAYDTVGTVVPQTGAQRTDINSWDTLLEVVRNTDSDDDHYDGWYRELDPSLVPGDASERVISKPAILSGVLFVPVYIPDGDVCGFGGSADTYGVYFESGTPMWRHIFHSTSDTEGSQVRYRGEKMLNAGPPPPTVSVHIGRESGAKLFTQTGTGPVIESSVAIEDIKSDIEYWGELEEWTDIDPSTP